jgi:hypothetical protein
VLGVRVAKESGFDQQKFVRLDQGEAAFPLRKANVEATLSAAVKSLEFGLRASVTGAAIVWRPEKRREESAI